MRRVWRLGRPAEAKLAHAVAAKAFGMDLAVYRAMVDVVSINDYQRARDELSVQQAARDEARRQRLLENARLERVRESG